MRYPPVNNPEARRPTRGPVLGLELALRILALLDAVLIPGLVIFWITTLPGKGELVGAVAGTWMAWWGIKRASKAFFAFEEYRWFSRHLLKLAAFGLLLQMVAWLLR